MERYIVPRSTVLPRLPSSLRDGNEKIWKFFVKNGDSVLVAAV